VRDYVKNADFASPSNPLLFSLANGVSLVTRTDSLTLRAYGRTQLARCTVA
jgi:hypothetical protein